MKRRRIVSMIEEDASSIAVMTACLDEFNRHDISSALPEEQEQLRRSLRRFANLLTNFYRSEENLAKKVM